ncbi:MAG: flippase-like domain-containing protein [Candidatus Krumholzibacteriota bacterium]|nr:flippase-like domain-containing protein [Candidatus Krumholzibacteriota bacterium]
MKRWISFVLPLAGLALFAVIVQRTGVDQIVAVFRSADLTRLAFAPVLVGAIVVLRGLRWRIIMGGVGLDYSLSRATTVWAIGFFAAAVTPAKAGDAVRAFYVRADTNRSFGEAFLTVFVDRLWDLMFILASGLVTILVFSHRYAEVPSLWLVVAVTIVIGLVAILVTKRSLMIRLLKPLFGALVPDSYKNRFSLNFHSFYDSLQDYARPGRRHVGVLGITLVSWGLIFTLAWYIADLLGIDVSLSFIFLIMPIVTLVELVPVSVSGLGTREATVMYFFSAIGLANVEAVGFSIAYLIVGTYLTSLLGFIFWLRHPIRLRGQ